MTGNDLRLNLFYVFKEIMVESYTKRIESYIVQAEYIMHLIFLSVLEPPIQSAQ